MLKSMSYLFLLVVTLPGILCSQQAIAVDWFVDADADANGDGETWSTAFHEAFLAWTAQASDAQINAMVEFIQELMLE